MNTLADVPLNLLKPIHCRKPEILFTRVAGEKTGFPPRVVRYKNRMLVVGGHDGAKHLYAALDRSTGNTDGSTR